MMTETQRIFETYQRVWAEIDLDAAVENMKSMKANIAPDTRMMAVIKTDGYGHGAPQLARVLEPLDFVWGYAAATPEEAHIIRGSGAKKPILILGSVFPYSYDMLAGEEIRPTVFREDSLARLDAAAAAAGKKLKVHIKVDTGMGRIGILPDEEGCRFVGKLLACEHLEIEGIFTHFARADEYDKKATEEQTRKFRGFLDEIERRFQIRIPLKHCSNSAGILEFPQANFDLVRAGITLYGLRPSDEVRMDTVPLRPVLSLYSHVVHIKEIHAGQSISYGGTFTAKDTMKIATVPVGYGDGYPRSLSGKGYVMIRGRKAPILGRVCMDQFMVDVTDIPEARTEDRVCLIGEGITADEMGELSGRFNYELVCDLGKRIPRVFYENGRMVAVRDYNEDFR